MGADAGTPGAPARPDEGAASSRRGPTKAPPPAGAPHAPPPASAPRAPRDDEALDALLAVYGRPHDEPLPMLPADLVAQLNKMTLAVVRETVVSLVRETVAQIAPAMMEQAAQQAIADYARNIILSLIRFVDPEKGRP